MGRAGKVTGKYPSWLNVRNTVENEDKSVDLDTVEWQDINQEEVNFVQLNTKNDSAHDQTLIENAKQTELDKLRQFNTFDEIEDHGQNTISTRWVITVMLMIFYMQEKWNFKICCTD